jgi:membrane protein
MVVGDTPYDIEAAANCGISAIGLRSGGFEDGALLRAGAVELYDEAAALLQNYGASALAAGAQPNADLSLDDKLEGRR